jgi:4-amino-4-deoxy-L-arabinose transferase-like glycosyltransferase
MKERYIKIFKYADSHGGFLLLLYIPIVFFLFLSHTVPFTGYETDGVYYMINANNFFTDKFMPTTFGGGIGMPLAIYLFDNIVHDTFTSAKIVSAIACLLFLIASLRVITKLYSPTTGFWALILLLVNPTVLIYSTTPLSDMLAASLVMIALWVLLAEKKQRGFLIVGICLGFAWMVRPINIVFWPFILFALLNYDRDKSYAIKSLVFGGIGLFLGCLPQFIINIKYFGASFHTENWRNIAMMLYGETNNERIHSFSEILRNDWLRLCYMWIKRFIVQVPIKLFEVAYWPVLFAIPGYALTVRYPHKRRVLLIFWGIIAVLYMFLIAPVWRIENRYFLPILPIVVASGVAMWQKVVNDNKYGIVIGLILAVSISAGAAIKNTKEILNTQAPEFKQAGLFLRNEAGPNDVILASQPHIFFYAERPGILFEGLSFEEINDLKKTVRDRHVSWVVFDERRGSLKFHALNYLLEPNSSLGWRLAYSNNDAPRIVIWHVPN